MRRASALIASRLILGKWAAIKLCSWGRDTNHVRVSLGWATSARSICRGQVISNFPRHFASFRRLSFVHLESGYPRIANMLLCLPRSRNGCFGRHVTCLTAVTFLRPHLWAFTEIAFHFCNVWFLFADISNEISAGPAEVIGFAEVSFCSWLSGTKGSFVKLFFQDLDANRKAFLLQMFIREIGRWIEKCSVSGRCRTSGVSESIWPFVYAWLWPVKIRPLISWLRFKFY